MSTAPVEPVPEQPGAVTSIVAETQQPPQDKGPAKALMQAQPPTEVVSVVKRYRVLNDRMIAGASGTRARMRAGKEIDSRMYNIEKLRQQGVQLQEI